MKSELAGGNTFASPRLLRYVSYASCVTKTRIVGRSPSSGRCPRSWDFAVTAVAAPNPTATPSPAPSPTETAGPSQAPLALTGFRFGGRSYVGVVVPDLGRGFVAPFAGTVEVRTYQFIDGEVRLGSNVPSLAFYPYISVVAADRKITYRPGTLGS